MPGQKWGPSEKRDPLVADATLQYKYAACKREWPPSVYPEQQHTCSTMAVLASRPAPMEFISQSHWSDARGPPGVDKKSPALATKGDADPQWLKDLQRDGVSIC